MLTRWLVVALLVTVLSATVYTQAKRASVSPKAVASSLLRLANTIESSQMKAEDRERYAQQLEALSAEIVRQYNTGALCSTDSDCVKKFGTDK